MRGAAALGLSLLLLGAGCNATPSLEAEVGSFNEGCGLDGTHSTPVGEHSCACEPGYTWCSEDPSQFECCISPSGETDAGDELPPDEPCDGSNAEALRCVSDDDQDPGMATVWACNGERWVDVPGYADFACMAEGLPFAFGCVPGPTFLCGFGPGNVCDPADFNGICVDADIIDTCVWNRRTVDRCSRLCAELEAFGPGFTTGACVQVDDEPAACSCA